MHGAESVPRSARRKEAVHLAADTGFEARDLVRNYFTNLCLGVVAFITSFSRSFFLSSSSFRFLLFFLERER